MSPLLVVTLVLISHTAFATNEPGDKTTSSDGLSTKAIEWISLYEKSIKYWDTTSVEARKVIIKQLAEPEDIKFQLPGCPRIRYPMVCDNDGMLLENACYFRMRRRERQGLLPVLVFTTTPIEEAKALCDGRMRKP